MKVFFSTLSAILVAALIIWAIATAFSLREQDAYTRQIILKGELQRMSYEWAERASKDPQFDPRMEKLEARRREIEEASEAGKPIRVSKNSARKSNRESGQLRQADTTRNSTQSIQAASLNAMVVTGTNRLE